MTTKEYLSQIDRLNKAINNKLADIHQLKTIACSISSLTSSEKVQSSRQADKLGDSVAKIYDLENQTKKLLEEYIQQRQTIICQIDMMADTCQYQVLFSKYVQYKTFEVIAEEMNYSSRQVMRIHREALKICQQIKELQAS